METKERKTTLMSENKVNETKSAERSTVIMSENSERKTSVMPSNGERSTALMPNNVINQRSTITLFGDDSKTNGKEVDVNSLIGEVIEGYEIDEVISYNSGQSVVYTGVNKNKKVVIKLYRDDATVIDSDVVEILTNIKSDYVIPILKSGNYNGRFYTITPFYEEGCVMDHLPELDKNLLKKKYINQLNEALNAIHKAGIMHCDIKPHNMYFADNRQRIVLGDFGIALAVNKYGAEEGKIGKYIPKRNLLENNATKAYLAPEGDEYVSELVDYYALGMSILNMAFGGDVYEDVNDDIIRDVLMNEPIRIPDNVDREIAMLVLKLLESDPKRRISYKEIKKWCKDTTIFGRYTNKEKSLCPIQINHALVNGVICDSTEEYVDTLLDNFDYGFENEYKTEKLHNLLANVEDVDRSLIKELAKIKEEYTGSKFEDFGFLLTLLKLSPTARFKYRDLDFGDFKGYIKHLRENNEHYFYSEDIILQVLQNEKITHNIEDPDRAIEICQKLFSHDNFTMEHRVDMLCNYFYDDPSFMLYREVFDDFSQLAYLMFDEDFEPNGLEEIYNDVFLDCFLSRDANLKQHEKEIREIFAIKDNFERNAKFSLFLTGQIVYQYNDVFYNNLYAFCEWAKDIYENSLDCSQLADLLESGKLYKAAQYIPDIDKDALELLKSFTTDLYGDVDDEDIVTIFYNKTQENAAFVLDGVKVDSMEDLINKLSKVGDIESVSKKLVESYQFRVWLLNSGYTDAFKFLEGK